jgi:hypothetical protein
MTFPIAQIFYLQYNYELERLWKEAAVASFRVRLLFRHLYGWAEKNREKNVCLLQ